MLKRSFLIASFVLLLPFTASAASFCPQLTEDMWYGSCDASINDADCDRHVQGDQVSQLQRFLREYFNNPQGLWTSGFFGPKTKFYVQKFQSEWDVPTTGRAGPLTRAAIEAACGDGYVPPPSAPSSVTMTASPTSGTAPLLVNFFLDTAGSACSTYIIEYGDGANETLANFCGTRMLQHTYTTQGTYNARFDKYVNSGGEVVRVTQAQATVTVGAAPIVQPTCTMSASRTSIAPSEPVTITWSSTNATSAMWSDGEATGTSGSAVFTNIATTTVKGITFVGPGGSRACSVTISVVQPTVPPAESTRVIAQGNAVANGGTIKLTSGLNTNVRLAEFTLNASGPGIVSLNSLQFTIRNQTSSGASSSATVANVRTLVSGSSYSASSVVSGFSTEYTVSLPGSIIPTNGSITVAVFADITPLSTGTLDLRIYPEDIGLTADGAAIAATSNVTNRDDLALLYWSGWISTGSGSGSGGILSIVDDVYPDGYRHSPTDRHVSFRIDLSSLYGGMEPWRYELHYGDGQSAIVAYICPGRLGFDPSGGTPFPALGSNGSSECIYSYNYQARGVYTARLVDTKLACGPGATSCPGYEVARVSVPVE